MGVVYEVKSFKDLGRHLRKLLRKKERKLLKAQKRTAVYAAKKIAELVPVAFSELKDSIHVDGTKVIVDAPHAASVEVGSRPHTPPLEPLIKWVKLRGMQGLSNQGKVRSRRWINSSENESEFKSRSTARLVALTIKAMRKRNKYNSVDTPEAIARSIQKGIMIHGTKPTFFVKRSIPDIAEQLLQELKKTMNEVEDIK